MSHSSCGRDVVMRSCCCVVSHDVVIVGKSESSL